MARAVRQANEDLDDPEDAPQGAVDTEAMYNANQPFDDLDFDTYFGLLSMQNLVIARTYKGDEDDKVLQELKPRFIVTYDPDPAFIRRIEVNQVPHDKGSVRR